MNKYLRFVKKFSSGDNPLEVRLSQKHWDTQFKKGYWDFLLDAPPNVQAIVKLVTEHSKGKQCRILDVGCGNGIIPSLLKDAELTFSYVGTDVSEEALKQAKVIYPEGEYICADMEHPQNIDGTFDIVIYSEMLLYGNSRATLKAHDTYCTSDTLIIISMYRTWRTRIIWMLIHRHIKYSFIKRVHDEKRHISWDIKAGSKN